jgi:hypothetical protein
MVCFLRKNFLAAAEFIQQVHQTVSQKLAMPINNIPQ